MKLTDEQLKRIMPNAPYSKRAASLPILNKVMADYRINNERRVAAFLATLAVESGELRYQEEIASGKAYEGRKDLGNTEKGDGVRFKGHGRIQITGRANHQSYTNYLKRNAHLPFVDFIKEPKKLAQEPYATDSAGWFFAEKIKANPIADKGDFLTIQIRVNGRNKKTGLPNHWRERSNYYARALSALPDNFVLTAESAVNSPSSGNQPTENQTINLPEIQPSESISGEEAETTHTGETKADANQVSAASPAVETSQTERKETASGTVSTTVGTINEQDVSQPAEVKEPEKQGVFAKLSAGIGTLFGGTIIYTIAEKFGAMSFSTQAIILFSVVCVIALIGFMFWAALDAWKSAQRVRLEAEAKADPKKKDIVWV